MTTYPTDIDSYFRGVRLISDNYSGGAGGTFTDLVTGNEDWTVQGATPTFSTENSREGVDFANDATESILCPMYGTWEMTAVIVGRVGNTSVQYLAGGVGALHFGIYGYQGDTWFTTFVGGNPQATVSTNPNNLVVIAAGFSPKEGKLYLTGYDGSSIQRHSVTLNNTYEARMANEYFALGRTNTAYFTGRVEEDHLFARCLQFRDNDALEDMMLTIGAEAGI